MKREKQVELIKSAEERTRGYLRTWMSDSKFKAALRRITRPKEDGDDGAHYVTRVRKQACG